MRKPTDKCLLCDEKEATKEKSHLIPKFLAKGIFYGMKPRYGLLIEKDGSTEKIQDIIKEDYLFCPECEKGFSLYETYCSLRLERYNESKFDKNFKRYQNKEFKFFECLDIDIRLFNLFIYSIIWRLSISKEYSFLKLKLACEEEEKLRLILKDNTYSTQQELIEKLDEISCLPNHSHLIIRPTKKIRPPSSMLSAASLNEGVHKLHLVDYVIFYFSDQDKMIQYLRTIDNNKIDGLVRVGLTSPEIWERFNFDIIKKTMK